MSTEPIFRLSVGVRSSLQLQALLLEPEETGIEGLIHRHTLDSEFSLQHDNC